MINVMSETTSSSEPEPEPEARPVEPATAAPAAVTTTQEPVVVERKHSRLNQVAVWIGIVAGSVFIVGAIFFSGFFLGLVAGHGYGGHGGHGGHHRGGSETSMHHQGQGPMFPGSMHPGFTFPGGPGGFPGGGPGGGPGMQGPQGPQSAQPSTSAAPTPPR